MLINEVEHIVGLSKKSIRYYEENGLLTPTRNKENAYRVYTEEDVKKLKMIKFLRELDVPICELKNLNNGNITLQECMKERIRKIEAEEEKIKKIKEMCLEIKEAEYSFLQMDVTTYFQEVNKLNKEGFTMRNIKTSKKKKIIGASMASLIFSLFFILLIVGISYFQLTGTDKIPWLIYGILMVLFLFPIISIGYNLVMRIKEIKGGEEDEASKY